MTQPNLTLYIQNLGETCKPSDVKRLLYGLFSAHGKVLDVVVTPKMKGQAFVVFADLQASTAARRREDGQAFLGKRMRIHYAKDNSHATILHQQGADALYRKKMNILEERNGGKLTVSSAQKDQMDASAAASNKNKRGDDSDEDDEDADTEQPKQKKLKVSADDDDEAAMEEESDDDDDDDAVGPTPASSSAAPQEVPHNVLFVTNLPSEVTSDMLTVLFQQFPGYTSVRYQSVSGTAHVTYDNWTSAAEAKKATDGFQIAPEVLIGVQFAERST